MPKKIPQKELDAIVIVVAGFPAGASLQDIVKKLTITLPRRTLQRRLASLVQAKQLNIHGSGKAVHYKLPQTRIHWRIAEAVDNSVPSEVYVPISSASEKIKQAVRSAIQKRLPVGYNRHFLDAYKPNITQYLPKQTQEHLHKIGRAPDGNHPAGTYARQILNRLLIDLSWNSSRLEGNTYSLLETERLLELGEAAEHKQAFESQMILNHKEAIRFLVDTAEDLRFNRYTILNLHALLAYNLLGNPEACGRLRRIPVGIHKTVYHPPEIPQLIEECFQQILDTASAIHDPFEQAFFAMVHLPYLQPFEDVNKRVSRLASNIPLIQNNLSPLSFVDVPAHAYIDGMVGVYELNQVELLRDVFIWAYERSALRYSVVCRSLGEPDPFRLHYRNLIAEIITVVIQKRLNKQQADAFIKQQANTSMPENLRSRLIEVVETELGALHEGNIACYRIRPSEFTSWRSSWK